jgi:c-di-GMP-related signal transduction protein
LSNAANTTLLARQGIYNKAGFICAYELLYRGDEAISANLFDQGSLEADTATSAVITQLFTNADMGLVLGNKPGFINFTRNHLLRHLPVLLPKNRIVIEVLEHIDIDQSVIDSIISLSKHGYKIALDDFIFEEKLAPLIDIADIIKIDVLNQNESDIKRQLGRLDGFKGKLLAEKIEDKQQFESCRALGFDLFQGFFLNKPDPVKGQIITENKTQLLRILSELYNRDVSVSHVETIILQIPKLSYRILRLANSAALYSGKKMRSLEEAIVQLGLVQIRNWVNLFLASSQNEVADDLLERTLIRAKMCELLSRESGLSHPHTAYTTGILSTLDGMMNETMESLLSKIRLSEELHEALINKGGPLGNILEQVIQYEKADFSKLDYSVFTNEQYSQSYLNGIEYAACVMASIKIDPKISIKE